MSHEPMDQPWQRMVRVLRPAWELDSITLEQAALAFEQASDGQISPHTMRRLVKRIRRALDETVAGDELVGRLGLLFAIDTLRWQTPHRLRSEMVYHFSDFVTDVDSYNVDTAGLCPEPVRMDWSERRESWSDCSSIEVLRVEPGDRAAWNALDHGTSDTHAYSVWNESDLSVDHMEYGRLDESLVAHDERLRGYLDN